MNDDSARAAARLGLDSLVPLFGLRVDATRAEWLRPLVESLLRHGDRLTHTADPSVEPICIGGKA